MDYIILALLILFNGFFALSEIAIVSCKKSKLELLIKEGKRGAISALKLHQNSENFLSAIQVGITLVSMVTGLIGGSNLSVKLAPVLAKIPFLAPAATEIAMTIAMLLVMYFSIVLGELVPKTMALSKPERIASAIAPLITFFSRVLYPFVWLLAVSTNAVNKILGIQKIDDKVTESELRQMLRTASSEGIIEDEQTIFHENIFNFSDKHAQHLITYRSEIEWIDINSPQNEIIEELKTFTHSKIVVADGDLDNFIGILHLKKFYKSLYLGENTTDLRPLLDTPIVVPENMGAQDVLEKLRADESSICFVVNEFGVLEGIITLFDVLENIVGQIVEENDPDPDVFVRDDNSYLVNGDAPVETLVGIIDDFIVDFDAIDYSTVAGFVLNIINEIPSVGYKFNYKHYCFEIVDMDGNRIDKILINKNINNEI